MQFIEGHKSPFPFPSYSQPTPTTTSSKRRNHVFKVGGPIHRSRAITTLLQKKIRQVYPVWCSGYIITLNSSKSYVKSWGSVPIWGVRTPRPPGGCDHASSPTHNPWKSVMCDFHITLSHQADSQFESSQPIVKWSPCILA